MLLSQLPTEVLKLILNADGLSSDVFELWKSGDRLLISKIALGGVTRIVLSYAGDCPPWPKCLRSLGLEEFEIDASLASSESFPTRAFRHEL